MFPLLFYTRYIGSLPFWPSGALSRYLPHRIRRYQRCCFQYAVSAFLILSMSLLSRSRILSMKFRSDSRAARSVGSGKFSLGAVIPETVSSSLAEKILKFLCQLFFEIFNVFLFHNNTPNAWNKIYLKDLNSIIKNDCKALILIQGLQDLLIVVFHLRD